MNIFKSTTVLATSFLMLIGQGCASAPSSGDTAANLPKAKSPAFVEFRDRCPIADPDTRPTPEGIFSATAVAVLTAVGDAAIPVLTNALFDAIAARAEAKLKAKSASSTAMSAGNPKDLFYDLEFALDKDKNVVVSGATSRIGCVVYTRGAVKNQKTFNDLKALNKGWNTSGNVRTGSETFASSTELVPELHAEFYVEYVKAISATATKEGEIKQTEVTVGWRLRPVLIAFGGTAAKETGKARQKDIAIDVTIDGFMKGDKAPAKKTIGSGQFVFEDFPIGKVAYVEKPKFDPEEPDAEKNFLFEKAPAELRQMSEIQALPSPEMKIGGTTYFTEIPLLAKVQVLETEAENDLGRALLDGIKKDKAKITAPIDARLKALLQDILNEKDK